MRLTAANIYSGNDLDFNNEITHILDPKKDIEGEVVYMTPDIKSMLKAYKTPPNEYEWQKNQRNIEYIFTDS